MGNFFIRLLGGFLAALFISSAHAETIPTDYQLVAPSHYVLYGGQIGSTPEAACAVRGFTTVCQESGLNARVASCGTTSCGSDSAYAVCPPGTSWNKSLFTCRTNIPSCPQTGGWMLQGTNCYRPDCQPGETRNPTTGACEKLCPVGWEKDAQGVCRKDCTNRLGRALLDDIYDTDENGEGQYDDCKVKCRKVVEYIGINIGGEESDFYSSGGCYYTGASADGTEKDLGSTGRKKETKKPQKPEDCLGSGDGYVQSSTGAVTCVPSKQAPAGQKPKQVKETQESKTEIKDGSGNVTGTVEKITQTTTNADGTRSTTISETTGNGDGTNTVTETTETVGQNGEVTKTVTKKTVAADGTETKTGEQTEKAPFDDFCQKNPTSPICKEAEKSVFGGSCESGFDCDGDAATCAIAKASHELKCQGETRGELNDLGDTVIAGTDGKGVDTIPNETSDLSSAINSGAGGGASCPPLPQIMGKTIEIDAACSILQGLGNAGVALSLLMAGFIVVGGIRGL